MRRKQSKKQASSPEQDSNPDTTDQGEDFELVIEEELDAAAQEVVHQLMVQVEESEAARKRAMADFVNFQRRARESEIAARREGISSTVRSLLPALDNFDLALAQDLGQTSPEQLLEGIRMVRDQLITAVEGLGIRRIAPAPGDDFDPNHHQAVVQQPSDEYPAGSVLATLQVGFTMNEMVLRPATVMVVVASEPAPAASAPTTPPGDAGDADELGVPGAAEASDEPDSAPRSEDGPPVVYDISDADAGLEDLFEDENDADSRRHEEGD